MSVAAYSLHIGLNEVNPARYGGWNGRLYGCHNDANLWKALAQSLGYTVYDVLLSQEAYFLAVSNAIAGLRAKVRAGDTVLITYSGHGGLVRDVDGDEKFGFDATWILYDREVTDDEINAAFAGFPAGVTLYIVSDSCHSATVARFLSAVGSEVVMPFGRLRQAPLGAIEYNRRSRGVDASEPRAFRLTQQNFGPRLVLLAGCKEQEVSYDRYKGREVGALSGSATDLLIKYKADLSFYKLRERCARALSGTGQHPQLMGINEGDLLNAKAFAIIKSA
jgi:hypothetical protein